MTHDYVPYVGRLRRGSEHLYAATGYSKWGMTNGTAAAMIVADRILGRRNPWAELYDSKRLVRRSGLASFLKANASAGIRFFADRLSRADRVAVQDLTPGSGAIVRVRGRKTAVYRDEQGALHALSPVCQHLYCLVDWNPAERTWDCPCHGSRYAGDGRAIQGPTTKDLKRRELPDVRHAAGVGCGAGARPAADCEGAGSRRRRPLLRHERRRERLHVNCAARVRGCSATTWRRRAGWISPTTTSFCRHGSCSSAVASACARRRMGRSEANDHYFAICFLGDDSVGRADVTPDARRALQQLIAEYRRRYPKARDVRPHSDFFATQCPGDELRALIRAF